MCEELINVYDGIVFGLTTEEEIEMFPDAVKRIRSVEPERKIIAIIEDIDAFTQASNRLNTLLLNILDGNLKLSGLVTIATTNHIEYLEERYTNRPSRFDRVVEFPLPNAESRKMFIEKTVQPEDLNKIDINEWVEKTEGFTIDHINELILLFFVFGHSEDEAFETLFAMTKTKGKLKNKTSVNKKDIGF
jgi:SpoVK/Ycf46/Vps4 family AAA+-type ATPase